jgi:hypothetical protein
VPLRLDGHAFPEALAAFGSRARGVSGFTRSRREAVYARRVAQLTRRRPGSVTRYDDVAIAALASADVEQARAYVATELGQPAARDDLSPRFSATLRIYLEENMTRCEPRSASVFTSTVIISSVRAAQELLRRQIEHCWPELLVALRLIKLRRDA